MAITIPETELTMIAARSSGPGGQNVNKTSSKIILRWHLENSLVLNDAQKAVLRAALGNRVKNAGYVQIAVEEERSQFQNRARAIKLLHELVRHALTPKRKRVTTKPTTASVKRRIADKEHRARKKNFRGAKNID